MYVLVSAVFVFVAAVAMGPDTTTDRVTDPEGNERFLIERNNKGPLRTACQFVMLTFVFAAFTLAIMVSTGRV